MEVKVSVIIVKDPVSGVSASSGKSWCKHQFVGETYDQFPKKLLFTFFEKPDRKMEDPHVGDNIKVSFDIESRSNIGKNGLEYWNTDLVPWKIEANTDPNDVIGPNINQPVAPSAPQPAAPAPKPIPQQQSFFPINNSGVNESFGTPQPIDDMPF